MVLGCKVHKLLMDGNRTVLQHLNNYIAVPAGTVNCVLHYSGLRSGWAIHCHYRNGLSRIRRILRNRLDSSFSGMSKLPRMKTSWFLLSKPAG